jgi:AcrR family transcriptional regulator
MSHHPLTGPPTVTGNLKDLELLEERRRQLVEAATEVFAERGYGRAGVNEIAERCGWSVGAIYRYVSSKEDILFLVCAEIFRRIGPESLAADLRGEPVDRLRTAYDKYCENIQAHRRQVLLMYREYGALSPAAQRYFVELESAVADTFRGLVEEGVRAGAFVCEDPRLFATDLVMRAHVVALKGWALAQTPPAEARRLLVRWALRALAAGG